MTLTQSFLGMCLEKPSILFETKLTENDFTDPIEQKDIFRNEAHYDGRWCARPNIP